jgi:hypothetical protein
MHLLSLAIFIVCAISATLSDRTFRLTNQCDQTIWFGIQGQPLIYSGSVEVGAGSFQDINVPEGWVRKSSFACFSFIVFMQNIDEWTFLGANWMPMDLVSNAMESVVNRQRHLSNSHSTERMT